MNAIPEIIAAPLAAYANVAGNAYDKYGTRNPFARALMNGFLGAFDALTGGIAPRSAFEVGCGEGKLSLRLLGRGVEVRGCDLEAEIVSEANEAAMLRGFGQRFTARSLYDFAPSEIEADLIVCCEVLEHLPDPALALDILSAQRASHYLLSVPREPLWRAMNLARGKYVASLGNTPGHIQHFSRRSFVGMVERRFEVLALRSPLPWTMLLCRPRGAA